jgi:hypothetical protein
METFSNTVGSWMTPVGAMLGPFAPRLLAALAILAAAWLGARLASVAVRRVAERSGLEDKLHSKGLAATLASLASAGVWLLALPALLGTLELQGLLAPVNAMLSRLLGFVPNLFGSAVVLGVGLLMARIARQIVVGLLQAAGSEKAAQRIGMGSALGPDGLAGIAGNALYVLILLPTLVAALQPLGLDALTQPLSRLLDTVTSTIPRLVSAAILVGVALLIGRALATVVAALLAGMGLDTLPERLGAAPLRLAGRTLSELAGAGVMVLVVTVALAQASEILGLPVLTQIVSTVGAAAGQVAVATVLLGAGVFLASAAARAIQASSLRNAVLLGWLARGGILFFAAALALRQAGLPPEIVTLAFGAVVGALALGLGVAIGVGGRHAAGRVMERFVASFEAPPPGSTALPGQAGPTPAQAPPPPGGQPS